MGHTVLVTIFVQDKQMIQRTRGMSVNGISGKLIEIQYARSLSSRTERKKQLSN